MPYLAEAAISAAQSWPAIDFMRRAYESNGEPLRLLESGQRWFARVLSHERDGTQSDTALVLGATPWLAGLIRGTAALTTVADTSTAMLNLCAESVRMSANGACRGRIDFLHRNWLALPPNVQGLDVVAGDNAFSFLQYPDEWDRLLELLADRMTAGAVLLSRLLAIPGEHRRLDAAEIIRATLARRAPVNFTALRVALLFAHWDSAEYTIRPEDALDTFQEHRAEFDPLLCDVANATENDLLSIEKYRGTGVTYFVPPLADAIAVFERHFRVSAVYFGPYEMSQYFPLIAAARR